MIDYATDAPGCVACHTDVVAREGSGTPGEAVVVVLGLLAAGKPMDRMLLDLCPKHRSAFVLAAEAAKAGIVDVARVDRTEN